MTKKLLPAAKAKRPPRRKLIPIPWQTELRMTHAAVMDISVGAARVGLTPAEFIRVACAEKYRRDLQLAQARSRDAHGAQGGLAILGVDPTPFRRDGDPEPS